MKCKWYERTVLEKELSTVGLIDMVVIEGLNLRGIGQT
jgi:hypothetical protein